MGAELQYLSKIKRVKGVGACALIVYELDIVWLSRITVQPKPPETKSIRKPNTPKDCFLTDLIHLVVNAP